MEDVAKPNKITHMEEDSMDLQISTNPTIENSSSDVATQNRTDPEIAVKVSSLAIISFREVVANSSQWFTEARKNMETSTDWDKTEVIPPESSLAAQFSKATLERLRHPWKMTLMGKCLGLSIKASFMETRVRIMWKIKGGLEVINLGNNVFLFRFAMMDDFERATFGGPWFILDHYLMITKWRPNFRPSSNSF